MGLNFQIWAVILTLGLILVAHYAYRDTTPPIPRRLRLILSSLRVLAFVLIAFLFMDPRYVFHSQKKEPPHVIALIDQSASMGLPSGRPGEAKSRFDAAVDASRSIQKVIEGDGGTYTEVYFSHDLVTVAGDTLGPSGQGTDIGKALSSLHAKHEGENVAAFVLLSDGVETTDPLLRHHAPPVPVFSIGLGDTMAPEDVRIKDVDYNAIVRVPSRSRIMTTLHYSGVEPKPIEVRLLEGRNTVFEKDTLFASGVHEIELEIPVEFREPGRREFTLEAVVNGFDAEPDNNRRDVVIEAEKAGVRILIVDLLPEWELHFLTEFLRNDESFDFDLVSTFGTNSPQRIDRIETRQNFLQKLDGYDALVLASLTEDFLTSEVTNAINEFVSEEGKGLLILPGHASLFERAAAWSRLADLLPVRGTPPHRFTLRFTSVQPGAQARTNPITSQLVPLLSQTDWQQRSPLLGFYSPLVPKSGVEVLLETVGQKSPAFTYQVVGKGRVALLSVGPLWRWKFLSDGNTMYDEMISRLLDVLSRGEDTERFALFSQKNVYDSGENPTITAEVFDEKMQPITGAPVRLEVARLDSDGREVPLDIVSMHRDGPNNPRYTVDLAALAPGSYRLRGEAELPGRVVSSQAVDISVSKVSVEFQRVAQDKLNLLRISAQSNGRYAAFDDAIGSVGRIQLEPRVVSTTSEVALRTSVIVFAIILLLLGAEWVIRKRVGMV